MAVQYGKAQPDRGHLEDALSGAVSEISALKSAHEMQLARLVSELRALKALLRTARTRTRRVCRLAGVDEGQESGFA